MTLCRGPKRKPVRTQPNRPLIAVKVATGCSCSASSAADVFLDVSRDGERDAEVIRYPIYDYNSDGDPRFFLDYQILNTPGIYKAVLKSFNVYQPVESLRFVTCGEFQLIIGPSCSVLDYVSMPANAPNEPSRTPDAPLVYDDMQPSYAIELLLT
jgi:hypothetical protein